jgi:hypothetical protein
MKRWGQKNSEPSSLTNCIGTVIAVFMLACFIIGCSIFLIPYFNRVAAPETDPMFLQPNIEQQILIPEGYTLIGASAYGYTKAITTFYCRLNGTNQVFICNNGVAGRQIILPEGYTFVAAASIGQSAEVVTFYCQDNKTGLVYICKE